MASVFLSNLCSDRRWHDCGGCARYAVGDDWRRVSTYTAGWVLLMHYLDLYWIIMPALTSSAAFHWSDAAALLAIGAVVGSGVWWLFRDRPLVAVGDGRLAESVGLRRAE